MKKKLRAALAVLCLCGATAAVGAGPANAWPWDPHVHVNANVWTCAGNDWGWYSASDGESGWTSWNGSILGFDLYRIPTSGTSVRISWGLNGSNCSRTVYRTINRPLTGSNLYIGNLG
jgi:hypothetical protein